MSFEKNLRDTARTLPQKQVSESFMARTQAALDQVDYAPRSAKAPLLPRRALLAGLAATCVGTSLFFAPRFVMNRSYAAEMHQAMQKANTWHFYGWRLVNGKKVPWEVWGRRSPFLYREQMGDETLIDDGVRRVHILPPNTSEGQTHGIYLVTPSEPLGNTQVNANTSTGSASFLAGIGGDTPALNCRDAGDYFVCTGKTTYMSNNETQETATLIANKKTHLPTRYVVERQTFRYDGDPAQGNVNWDKKTLTGSYTQAELTPEYNQPLPDEVTRVTPPPASYTITNAMTAIAGDSEDGSVCARKGVTLKAQVIGQDKEGNLRVRFKGWLGSEPIRYRTQHLRLMVQASMDRMDMRQGPANLDDAGNPYVQISLPPGRATDSEHPELWLVTAEPLTEGSVAPKTVQLTIWADLNKYERMGNSGRTIPLVQDMFTFTLPLPTKKAPLGWDTMPSSHGVKHVGVRPTFQLESAEKRGAYYFRSAMPATDHKIPSLDRASYWYNVTLEEATQTQNRMMVDLAHKNLAEVARLKSSLTSPATDR